MADAAPAAASGGAPAPAIVLVAPQLGENIGMAARAMLNCGLYDLRLVRPREPWPNARAMAAAAGADRVVEGARVFETLADAIADLSRVYATTARVRDMTKPQLTPRAAAAALHAAAAAGGRCGLVFGREATGLDNDDVALADAVLTVPLNPEFTSLNLAMAVLLVGYEWRMAAIPVEAQRLRMPAETRPASKAELMGLFAHLEAELDRCGFLRLIEKRPIMVRNLRNIFGRAQLTEQEVRTLRGVIACLVGGGARPRSPGEAP
jgi:tRNA/rRNA methyltransferase